MTLEVIVKVIRRDIAKIRVHNLNHDHGEL
jgi:hypothetical protein